MADHPVGFRQDSKRKSDIQTFDYCTTLEGGDSHARSQTSGLPKTGTDGLSIVCLRVLYLQLPFGADLDAWWQIGWFCLAGLYGAVAKSWYRRIDQPRVQLRLHVHY